MNTQQEKNKNSIIENKIYNVIKCYNSNNNSIYLTNNNNNTVNGFHSHNNNLINKEIKFHNLNNKIIKDNLYNNFLIIKISIIIQILFNNRFNKHNKDKDLKQIKTKIGLHKDYNLDFLKDHKLIKINKDLQ